MSDKRGNSHKNGKYKKRGQTKSEALLTKRSLETNKERWERLFALNKWTKIT
jgi:hypothetical protein